MAAGDVVNGVQSIAATSTFNFQPAASVEIMLTTIAANDGDNNTNLYDGTTSSLFFRWNATSAYGGSITKCPINNSIYLRISNGAGVAKDSGYSGIQIK